MQRCGSSTHEILGPLCLKVRAIFITASVKLESYTDGLRAL